MVCMTSTTTVRFVPVFGQERRNCRKFSASQSRRPGQQETCILSFSTSAHVHRTYGWCDLALLIVRTLATSTIHSCIANSTSLCPAFWPCRGWLCVRFEKLFAVGFPTFFKAKLPCTPQNMTALLHRPQVNNCWNSFRL